MIYFLRGSLPWQGFNVKTKAEKYEIIKRKKLELSVDALCEGCPNELRDYMRYCRKLGFEERPDYDYLKSLFLTVIERERYKDDGIYDWIIVKRRHRMVRELQNEQSRSRMNTSAAHKMDDKYPFTKLFH